MASNIITLTEAKSHLRVTDTAEDTLIQLYIDAATEHISNYIDTPNPPQNAAVKAAALLIVGGLYENRESENVVKIEENPAVKRLLFPYRERLGV